MGKKSQERKPFESKLVPQTTSDEIVLILIAMLRSPKVRTEAIRFIKRDYFEPNRLVNYKADDSELAMTILFDVIVKLTPQYENKNEIPYLDIYAAASERLHSVSCTESNRDQILGKPGGLLHSAYFVLDRKDFSCKKVLALIKKFCYERRTHQYREAISSMYESLPVDLLAIETAYHEELSRISTIGTASIATTAFGALSPIHEAEVDQYRGRGLIGLKTGLDLLDLGMDGLRSKLIVGGAPGTGKTSLAIDAAVGVCRNFEVNDAVVVFVTLEMSSNAILSRFKANLADLDWKTYSKGSPLKYEWVPGTRFNVEDLARIKAGEKKAHLWQIDQRLHVLNSAFLGPAWDATQVIRAATEAKKAVGAKRVLVVIDHLQYIPVLGDTRSDVENDRSRMEVVKRIATGLVTTDDPDPAVFVICQTRKPPSSEREEWGTSLSEFLGSVEIPFAADAALTARRMSVDTVYDRYIGAPPTIKNKNQWQKERQALGKEKRAALWEQGVSPTVWAYEKAPDGMAPRVDELEFLYRRYQFRPLDPKNLHPLDAEEDKDIDVTPEGTAEIENEPGTEEPTQKAASVPAKASKGKKGKKADQTLKAELLAAWAANDGGVA